MANSDSRSVVTAPHGEGTKSHTAPAEAKRDQQRGGDAISRTQQLVRFRERPRVERSPRMLTRDTGCSPPPRQPSLPALQPLTNRRLTAARWRVILPLRPDAL